MVTEKQATPANGAIGVNWSALRQTYALLLSLGVAAGCVAWCLIAIRVPYLGLAVGVAIVLAGSGLSLRLRWSLPELAGLVLTSSCAVGIFTLWLWGGFRTAPYFLAIPVLIAGAFFGWRGLIPMTVVAVAGVSFLRHGNGQWVTQVLVLASVGSFAGLVLSPLQSSLGYAWQRSGQAAYLAEQLRDRQGALSRTLKTLELTNHLLQRSNRELELARREAEEARRLKAEFAASISHELRTPLNIILGFTEIMSRSPEVYGDVNWNLTLRRDITEIRRNAIYLSEFVDDILDLARVDALRMPIHREVTDLAEVVQEAVGVAQRLLQGRPVQLLTQLQQPLPPLFIDRTRIRQVLLNLLTNACRFTERGQISISATLREEDVLVEVSDTGAGIPSQQLDRIFDQFEQVNAFRKAEQSGKGLGLAVAKQLVLLHGGHIWAESEVGQGSTFRFTLPLVPKIVNRLSSTVETPLSSVPFVPSLVVLDEEELAATYLERHLDGYRVHWAADAAEARQAIASLHPEAVILNLAPGGDLSVAQVKGLDLPAGVPVLGCSLPSRRWLERDDRFAAYLVKPISAEEMLATVRSLAPKGEVLVIDDDRGFVQFVQRGFQTLGGDGAGGPVASSAGGYHLRWAYDGEEALAMMDEVRPDLVLLDLALPGIDGLAVADAMRSSERLRGVPVVAVSGTNPGEEALAIRGETFVLTKARGFRGNELISLIKSALQVVHADYVSG